MNKGEVAQAIKGLIGKVSPASDWITITQKQINDFADTTGDHQWIHVDIERCKKESPFGGPIAHGYLTMSVAGQVVKDVALERTFRQYAKMGVNYGVNKVRFPSPVKAGARVRGTAKVIEVTEGDNYIQVVREVTLESEGGKRPCCVAEQVGRIYF
jgi:acyl dehydratase